MGNQNGGHRSGQQANRQGQVGVKCEWCGGDLISEELHLAGQWWLEPRCLQCGRVPAEHQPAPRGLAEQARLVRGDTTLPRDMRGWRDLMERRSR